MSSDPVEAGHRQRRLRFLRKPKSRSASRWSDVGSWRGCGTSRRALFEQLDRPALGSLSSTPYEYVEWKRCRVGRDDHIEIAKHCSSVPHQLIRQEVEVRITLATVEIFHRGKRVARHRGPSAHGLVP
jgi:hypothetical protein